ncbi:MAG: hypothetical protein Roseis2KO_14390 [Roseivirga sp.]
MRVEIPDNEPKEEKDKLRRWVSNLQLESWQLELLITGFSIFLLATSLDQYDAFKSAIEHNKLAPSSESGNPLVSLSVLVLLDTIPWALRFFLINLLIHLLLRGFWIGIVGLSSVSSEIHYDKLKLRGKFRKMLPQRVKTLDQLIVYLDKMSSVIFAYTYLLVFSIISVMLVFVLIIALSGTIFSLFAMASQGAVYVILGTLLALLIILIIVCAILFFLDTLTFSSLKRSKWFNPVFYPIYRFFSVLTLSFLYRSIYYHLITNYKRKHIIMVTLGLLAVFYLSRQFDAWDNHNHYPDSYGTSEFVIENRFYDDDRGDHHIQLVSIPSKYVENDYLELFVRYRPNQNAIMTFMCPDTQDMNRSESFLDGFNKGMEAGRDSTKSIGDLLAPDLDYADALKEAVNCLTQIFEVKIDGVVQEDLDFAFRMHPSKGEKGFFTIIDVSGLDRKKHVLEVNILRFDGAPFMEEITEEKLKMRLLARLPFWVK